MSMNVAEFKVTETEKVVAKFAGKEPKGAVDGKVHLPDCFIVTTHSPDRKWQPTSEQVTFCIKRAGGRP